MQVSLEYLKFQCTLTNNMVPKKISKECFKHKKLRLCESNVMLCKIGIEILWHHLEQLEIKMIVYQ